MSWNRRAGDRSTPQRLAGADQRGVAMVSAMLAIFILTVVVAALALATMGETTLSQDQRRSSQALHIAEAGAYRAWAELRQRIAFAMEGPVAAVPGATIFARCSANQGWRLIADYAYFAPGPSDWTNDAANKRAVLQIGTRASPIAVRDASGALVGSVYATVYVRPSDNGGGAGSNVCDSSTDSYRMWFDSFIVSTGLSRNAQATVCLKNTGNFANCGAWVTAANPGDSAWDTAPPTHGWQLYISKAAYSRWALMTLTTSNTWLVTGSNFLGPVHSNDRFSIWGDPVFYSRVTQVQNDVNFSSGGLVADDNYCAPAHPGGTDCPVYNGPPMERGASTVLPPGSDSPFWAVLNQVNTGIPGNSQIRNQTTDLVNGGAAVPPGIYFMDECANPTCGGIFVMGDAQNIFLCVAGVASPPCPAGPGINNVQHILITAAGTQKMFVLDPGGVQECTGPPAFSTCVNRGKGFNGMLYVHGNVTSTTGNPGTGLYGKIGQNYQLTVAADGEIKITDMLVYEYLPRPNDPRDPLPVVLGLYAWCSAPPTCPNRNVTVDGSLAPNDLNIHGSVLAPWGKFWVQGWDTLADKGTLTFLGGSVQNDFGEFGGFLTDAFGNILGYTGYGRNMIYDARFLGSFAPPYFPLTGSFTVDRNRIAPDNFYDRPLWEELAGQ